MPTADKRVWEHPEVLKYLNKDGKYDPHKSEKIREAYKEEYHHNRNLFRPAVSKLWNTIFKS